MTAFRNFVRFLLIIALIVTVNIGTVAYAEHSPQAKGIILLIGDGMGLNQIRSAGIYAKQILGQSLAIYSIPTCGTTTTHSANSEVTDSAAAATALYSGYKTNNGVLNLLPDGRKVFTIGHAAKKAGLSVGIVSTTRLTHATPAAIYSHSQHRNNENFIAKQLAEFSPEVALGGGAQHFIPQEQKGSKRKEPTNLIDVLKSKGYMCVTTAEELKTVDAAKSARLFGLFALSHMDYELDRQNEPELRDQPSLADMTRVALSVLDRNPKGFFVMIEGGRIDHACHSHDIKGLIYEMLAFDAAVRVALEYQKTHPDVTVVVTADHETGGLGLGRSTDYAVDLAALKPIRNSLDFLWNKIEKAPADIDELLKASGFDLTGGEKALLSKYPLETRSGKVPELGAHGKINGYVHSWAHYALSRIETERAKIGWTSFVHTAQPVLTCAVGPGEKDFAGHYDNTDIAKKMAKLLRLTLEQPGF